MVYVLRSIMKQEVVKLWHKDSSLEGCDFIVLPGGFSFGDYLRSGAIARFSPIMNSVIDHAAKGGYVFGVCNGFQILCESGLVDGALLHNNTQKFTCKNVFIKPANNSNIVTSQLDLNRAYQIPIAHGEGRFFADEDTLKRIQDNEQILFQYCDEKGMINEAANPNGTLLNIAGICNKNKNVFGMMPHPERAADAELGNVDGYEIFRSILESTVLA